ncbi:InlB B-repeat-containing protein [Paenibacillus macquariensis]|uniref:Listeria/Bacterioides repeat-containing protein n=1 Tax=Paenibacillus macquariensis TaxID=948756 RepID=A0ABY1JVV3_9BACL|nr:InlB B-repeat-containing protein [Paenibacillus macquariensis]MEC0090706.1 InlB B-repeat-containing protein [Paenibacillus macquariensis]OAB34456.1 hypothetical protein PMSM_11325 [Paenibacillus macquariensis subsp. macquariensis]SIQ85778.1 Listeria/Bacterioides repeat-containing protein [Paenibacillus macquariensis]
MHSVYKRGISIILVMLMVVGGLNGLFIGGGKTYAAGGFAGGTGTINDPYQIATADQLDEVRNHLEFGNYFELTANIDLSGYTTGDGWKPIGDSRYGFQGNMDGNGFKITNLTINRPNDHIVGLFGQTTSRSSFTNIMLENIRVQGNYNVGGLVGISWGSIRNSYTTGTINGVAYVGGLVGGNCGSISNSYSTGSVSGTEGVVGGLAGSSVGTSISNSYATGSVTGPSDLGGLIGYNLVTVSNSFYDSGTTGQADTRKGDGKTTVEMKTQSTYSSWNFNSEWYMLPGQYPQLWALTSLTKGIEIGKTKLSNIANGMEYSLNGGQYIEITDTSIDITVNVGNTISVRVTAAPSSAKTLTVDRTDIRGLTPPVLSEDTENNYRAIDTEITFTDDPVWSGLITAVTDGVTPLVKETQYTIDAGKITIKADVLAKGNHSIKITATGYDDAVVNQQIMLYSSPVLTADTENNYTVNSIDIMFVDDSVWRGVITAVTDGVTPLVKGTQYTTDNGKIIIKAGVLSLGDHKITVTATNYDDTVVNQSVGHFFTGEGTGSLSHPYLIATDDQLNEVRLHLEEGIYYKLTADIDLMDYAAGDGWMPIGKEYYNEFKGNMDGNGFKITNLKINKTNSDSVGLFGRIGYEGKISNLSLENISVIGSNSYSVGGLAGYNGGTINNSYTTGITKGLNDIGGLVGTNYGTISNSYSTVNVNGVSRVGGLAGSNQGAISNSYAIGIVKGTSEVGGLVGNNRGEISTSFYDKATTEQLDTEKGDGKTTEEMKMQSSYGSWLNFSNVWAIDPQRNNGYPHLRAFYLNVTYDGNGHTDGSVPMDSKSYTKEEPVSVIANTGNLGKEGYTFAGWNTLANGSGINYEPAATFKITEKNITLYAKWTLNNSPIIKYTVSYEVYGGSAVANVKVDYNTTITEPTAPTKANYSFGGWYKESELTNKWDFTTDKVIGDTMLYAKWTLNNSPIIQYTVSYEVYGGSTVANVNADYNTTITEPTAPTKANYSFGGWYKESELTNKWDFTTDKVIGDTTLFAKWTFNNSSNNGGGGSIPAPTPTPTVPTEAPPITPTPKPFFNEKVNNDVIKALVEKANTAPAVTFKDVPASAPNARAIELAAKLGIIKGNTDGSFHANATITRAEFATMLVRALGLTSEGTSSFKDTKGHWAADTIVTLQASGIINGYVDGTFKPNQTITRAEIVAMLSKVMNTTLVKNDKFNDISGNWAEAEIATLSDMGIVKGSTDGSFKPNSNATRADSLVMILRMLNASLGGSLDID